MPEISMISSEVVDWMYTTHGHKITQWNHHLLNLVALSQFADVISNKGAALERSFGFIDGTVRPISRLGANQRIVHNGRKRVHALEFQSVALPNGLIDHLYGPFGTEVHALKGHIVLIFTTFFFFHRRKNVRCKNVGSF